MKNSNAMELESLKRQLTYLEEAEIKIDKLVTDRHTQVSAFMAQEKSTIEHAYDAWHLAKGNVPPKFKPVCLCKTTCLVHLE